MDRDKYVHILTRIWSRQNRCAALEPGSPAVRKPIVALLGRAGMWVTLLGAPLLGFIPS
jgi:hypothetical protein